VKAPITVIVPVRNGAAYIGKAIESVLSQTFAELQLVVSDNGSTDGTREVVAKYLGDPRVRLVRQAQDYDMIGHFNRCLDMLDSEYHMLLCHDDYLYAPTALAKAHAALESHPEVHAAYCDLAYVDERDALIMVRKFARHGVVDSDRVARTAVVKTRNLFGIPLLVRTRALAGARYDRALPYAADLDLSIAISRHGAFYHLGEPLIANRYHGGNATLGLFGRARDQMKLIAAKHDIALSGLEGLRMALNSWTTALRKWAFLQYVGKMRTPAK
jgi:glycosyltransferase involved in cell wall biosynthesis